MSATDRARDLVADWTLLLVRGLPETLARDRFDEIASDLWEHQHAAAAHGRSSLGTAAGILLRALRGVPADLQWRWIVGRRSAVRFGGITVPRTRNPTAKPWVHLTGSEKPFDQTNGAVDFDEQDARDDSNSVRDLTEKAVIWNMIDIGGGGGL